MMVNNIGKTDGLIDNSINDPTDAFYDSMQKVRFGLLFGGRFAHFEHKVKKIHFNTKKRVFEKKNKCYNDLGSRDAIKNQKRNIRRLRNEKIC